MSTTTTTSKQQHQREQRRLQAADLFAQGVRQAEVARRLGVPPQTVNDWHKRWRHGGEQALDAKRPGRKPRLTPAQLKAVEHAIKLGPRAHGFDTQHWTLARIATVIHKVTGERYRYPAGVWKLLKRLEFSWQVPARQASERDEEAIAGWVAAQWPRVKKTRPSGARGSSS